MDGARNLSDEAALRYAEALGLEGDGAEYFCELVRFNQAKSTKERAAAYERVTKFRGYQRSQRLDHSHARYHSAWYIPAIREMAARPDFQNDPKWLADQMIPTITERQAEEALTVLQELGFLIKEKGGALRRANPIVSTGPETAGVHIANYHRTMMQQAMNSMDEVPAGERDISAVTLCLPTGSLEKIKRRVREFRKELIAMEAPDCEGDRVVQVGIQIFPLTKSRKP